MMPPRAHQFATIILAISSCAYAMEDQQNPMDAGWFYREDNPYAPANTLLQERKWSDAEQKYNELLAERAGTESDQDMAALNLASAQMAQRKPSVHWRSFAKLCGIAADRLLTQERLESFRSEEERGTVTVHSNMVGIGDIAHFFPVVKRLKDQGVDVQFAVRESMHTPLERPSETYGVTLIDEKEALNQDGYHTHLVALLGLMHIAPSDLASEKAIYTTIEQTIGKIRAALPADKTVSIVFLGEDRAATLIGGKQLPHDTKQHGRQLDAQAFERLLQQESNLVLLDCNPEKSRISFEDDATGNRQMSKEYQGRVISLPKEDSSFDAVIALGLIWNKDEKRFVGFAGDNGPPNLFAQTLDKNAQQRFVYIIPNGSEYDMRMEGEGKKYVQMLSHCPVYRCDNPKEQAATIVTAYNNITKTSEESADRADADNSCTVL